MPPLTPWRGTNDELQQFPGTSIKTIHNTRHSGITRKMDEEDDCPPMLVSSENVDDVDASLNAEMADAQIKKVPISIITGELSFHISFGWG